MVIFMFLILLVSFHRYYKYDERNYIDSPSIAQLSSAKNTIREFNLDKCQLAFTIGKKIIANNDVIYISYAFTTVFSEDMIENVD